jgi:hypothetical protein
MNVGGSTPQNVGLPLSDCIETPSNSPIVVSNFYDATNFNGNALQDGSPFTLNSPVFDKFQWKLSSSTSM